MGNDTPKTMSKTKRKRLEQFIARKLKKEERVELMSKLADSAIKSDLLISSKTLGNGKANAREQVRRALALERAGLPAEETTEPLYQEVVVDDVAPDGEYHEQVEHEQSPAEAVPVKPEKQVEFEFHLIPEKEEEPDKLMKFNPLHLGSPSIAVKVDRDEQVELQRRQLPILAEEHAIMELVMHNDVVILTGETGCGKTSQVPQFLFEYGFGNEKSKFNGMIAVTQPRRVAAISTAKRVAYEMNMKKGEVSYQVRYDNKTNQNTKIKFMTDGILLEEASRDFLLSRYSCIIIDEAHERSLNTDILIGLLSRIVKFRNKGENPEKPLRLIIMSATLRVKDFTENRILFPESPPVISVESRQYPVINHFNRTTPEDYMEAALRKVWKIHTRLSAGTILVFLTGQQEIAWMVEKLNEMENNHAPPVEKGHEDSEEEYEEKPEQVEIPEKLSLHPLMLYASLPAEEQMKIFQTVPAGKRLCVVATNVAETSITIPGVKYVVDCGKVKEKTYEISTSVSSFNVNWVSKSAADQRSGRAGRVGPGHCYRLYSSAVFHNKFQLFSLPEIERLPIDDVYLKMKSMNIDNVVNFPFPTPPDAYRVSASEKLLTRLGALAEGKLTKLGKFMSELPISPRLSRMIYAAVNTDVFHHVVALTCMLSVGEVFSIDFDKTRSQLKDASDNNVSDLLRYIIAFGAYQMSNDKKVFCVKNGLIHKLMVEAHQLFYQIIRLVDLALQKNLSEGEIKLQQLNQKKVAAICQSALSGLIDQIAIYDATKKSYKLALKDMDGNIQESVFIHPASVFSNKSPPAIVFYFELRQATKLNMRNITAIEDKRWLGVLGGALCSYSGILDNPAPRYDKKADKLFCTVKPKFGDVGLELPAIEKVFDKSLQQARWFAKFLLDGLIVEGLKKYCQDIEPSSCLLTSSSININHRKIIAIVHPLLQNSITSLQELKEIWKQKPQFLLNGYLAWIPAKLHPQIQASWPPL